MLENWDSKGSASRGLGGIGRPRVERFPPDERPIDVTCGNDILRFLGTVPANFPTTSMWLRYLGLVIAGKVKIIPDTLNQFYPNEYHFPGEGAELTPKALTRPYLGEAKSSIRLLQRLPDSSPQRLQLTAPRNSISIRPELELSGRPQFPSPAFSTQLLLEKAEGEFTISAVYPQEYVSVTDLDTFIEPVQSKLKFPKVVGQDDLRPDGHRQVTGITVRVRWEAPKPVWKVEANFYSEQIDFSNLHRDFRPHSPSIAYYYHSWSELLDALKELVPYWIPSPLLDISYQNTLFKGQVFEQETSMIRSVLQDILIAKHVAVSDLFFRFLGLGFPKWAKTTLPGVDTVSSMLVPMVCTPVREEIENQPDVIHQRLEELTLRLQLANVPKTKWLEQALTISNETLKVMEVLKEAQAIKTRERSLLKELKVQGVPSEHSADQQREIRDLEFKLCVAQHGALKLLTAESHVWTGLSLNRNSEVDQVGYNELIALDMMASAFVHRLQGTKNLLMTCTTRLGNLIARR